MEYECGDPDRVKYMAHVDFHVHATESLSRSRTRAPAFVACQPLQEESVASQARSELGRCRARAPRLPRHDDPLLEVFSGDAPEIAKPGGHITGLQILQDEIFGKRLQLLKEVRPNLSRAAFLDESVTHRVGPHTSKEQAARSLGLELNVYIATKPEDLPAMLGDMDKKAIRGLIIESTPFMARHEQHIVDLTVRHRLVAIHSLKRFAEAGGFMAYGVDFNEIYRRTAVFVNKILRGAQPADLPIEQPTKFILVINLKAAKALGLPIPPSLLQRADQVIE